MRSNGPRRRPAIRTPCSSSARIAYAGAILEAQGDQLAPADRATLLRDRANAAARAVTLYPTDATLQATLAQAAATLGRLPDAIKHGREALRLDALTPHADKKLLDPVRTALEKALAEWESEASRETERMGK